MSNFDFFKNEDLNDKILFFIYFRNFILFDFFTITFVSN